MPARVGIAPAVVALGPEALGLQAAEEVALGVGTIGEVAHSPSVVHVRLARGMLVVPWAHHQN